MLLTLIGMILSIQIELLKGHGTSVHSAQLHCSNKTFWYPVWAAESTLGRSRVPQYWGNGCCGRQSHCKYVVMNVLNALCTLWIHAVTRAVERCVHSAVRLLHAVRARFSVLLWWHEWTSVSYCDILSTVCCDTDKQQLCPSWRVGACNCH
jgi:hypothetical protein